MTKKNTLNTNNLSSQINNWLEYIQYVQNLSTCTVDSYKTDMKLFLSFCNENNLTNISDIQITNLHSYIIFMNKNGNASSTINRRIMSLKGFYSWLVSCNLIAEDITLKIKSVKLSKKVQVALEVDEAKELISLASVNKRGHNAIRNELITEVLLSTGVRVSELVNIKHTDIKNNMLLVTHGKGDKQRTVPLSDSMIAKINNYINYKTELKYTIDFLFVDTMKLNKQISERAVQNVVKDLMIKVDRPELSTHKTRTTFATVLASQNVPIRTIGDLLGHGNNLTVTSGYIAPNAMANSQAIMSNPIFR